MNFMSSNIQGLAQRAKKDWVKELCNINKVNFMSLQETKMESVKMFNIKLCWGNFTFDYVYSPSVGYSGGILCVWDPRVFLKSNSMVSDYFVMIRGEWKKLLIISIHTPQELSEKKMLWDYFTVVIGANAFNSFISDAGLEEVHLEKLDPTKAWYFIQFIAYRIMPLKAQGKSKPRVEDCYMDSVHYSHSIVQDYPIRRGIWESLILAIPPRRIKPTKETETLNNHCEILLPTGEHNDLINAWGIVSLSFLCVICFVNHSRQPPWETRIVSVLLEITPDLATRAIGTPLSSPNGNNVVPLRSDTIQLVQNGCLFHELRSEDPNQHLKDFLKLVDSLDLDVANRERTRLRLFQFSLRDQASNWLERLPAGSISTWEDLTTRFLAQFFPSGRTAKLRNDVLMFQQHQGEYLSEAWTHFKDLLQKVPHHGIDLWLQVQIFYDHVNPATRRTIDQSAGGKLRDRNAEESWALLEDLALYDNKSWNDPRDFAKPVKAISLPQDVPSTSDCRLIELEN
ncbi:zinc finger, CCHC-type containing protein [Tanacetum coccineum]|uniref:Zinc finger, CCHC-type containing protein n=1 Tax=Tanacetum coccineum TaxID=301880 RepID=A0ABQ5GMU7_9ASTR